MSGIFLAAVLVATAFAATGLPLLRGAARPLGRGLEDDAPVQRWQAERARLVGQMQDTDLALAEGRLDAATHAATAARLAQEADAVMARLRTARREFARRDAGPMRPGRFGSALALAAVIGVGTGAAWLARWQDIDLTGSPHADGRVPLDMAGATPAGKAADGAGPVIGADGAPDIGAMVARLEGRVAEGDASAEDIKMLLRSYDTLGRIEDARAVLDDALVRFPEDPELRIAWLRAVVSVPRDGDSARALPVADALIAEMPDLLEARWYRSLFLVAEGQRDAARTELMWMAPRLPAGSPAARAVGGLLTELAGPPVPQAAGGN